MFSVVASQSEKYLELPRHQATNLVHRMERHHEQMAAAIHNRQPKVPMVSFQLHGSFSNSRSLPKERVTFDMRELPWQENWVALTDFPPPSGAKVPRCSPNRRPHYLPSAVAKLIHQDRFKCQGCNAPHISKVGLLRHRLLAKDKSCWAPTKRLKEEEKDRANRSAIGPGLKVDEEELCNADRETTPIQWLLEAPNVKV